MSSAGRAIRQRADVKFDPLGGVAGQCAAGAKGFIIGMGKDAQQSSLFHDPSDPH